MPVLVDSTIWIDYFRSGENSNKLDYFIDEDILFINNLILAELIPFLKIKKQKLTPKNERQRYSIFS